MTTPTLLQGLPFLEPLSLQFFQLGLLAAVLTMVAGAGIGFTVVLRREAYFGQGIGQSMIAGVAIGALFDAPPAVSALVGALAAAGIVTVLSRSRIVGADTAIAVVATTAFSVGVAVISADRERAVNVGNVLFGNVLGVSHTDVAALLGAALVSWVFAWVAGRRLTLASAAPAVAQAHGVPITRLVAGRTVVLAAVTATAAQVVGVTLVVVALVFPAAVASLLARTFGGVHLVAVGAAVGVGLLGMYVSYWTDIASGPAIVLTAAALYLVAFLIASLRDSR